MRAIKIDAENRIITEVEISSDYKDLQKLVGGYICVAFYYPGQRNTCFVNDEGILNDPKYFFMSTHSMQPHAGNGIIVGTGKSGNTVSCKLKIEDVKDSISFYSISEIRALIRHGLLDYNSYLVTANGKQILSKNDLGAFDEYKSE